MEVQAGQIVLSRRGRDVTKPYVVLDVQPEGVLLADGDTKTMESPKRKNPRHLQPTSIFLAPAQTGTNLTIKTALNAFKKQMRPPQQGGQELGER